MSMRTASFILLLAGVSLVGHPMPVLAPPPHTGVQGTVAIQSRVIYIQLPDGSWVGLPMAIRPQDTIITICHAHTGRMVTRVATQAGSFSVSLPPGEYTLVPEPLPAAPGDIPTASPVQVTVRPRQFITISFIYHYPITPPPSR